MHLPLVSIIGPESGSRFWDRSDAHLLEKRLVSRGKPGPLFPTMRWVRRLCGALLLGLGVATGAESSLAPAQAQEVSETGFQRFVQGLWPAAKARGISRATFDEAFRGVQPDPKIVAL